MSIRENQAKFGIHAQEWLIIGILDVVLCCFVVFVFEIVVVDYSYLFLFLNHTAFCMSCTLK